MIETLTILLRVAGAGLILLAGLAVLFAVCGVWQAAWLR